MWTNQWLLDELIIWYAIWFWFNKFSVKLSSISLIDGGSLLLISYIEEDIISSSVNTEIHYLVITNFRLMLGF